MRVGKFEVVTTLATGAMQFAVVEHDDKGPILRLGPFDGQRYAEARAIDLHALDLNLSPPRARRLP
jgi:hypothetical protein